jgi:hypothetical protein
MFGGFDSYIEELWSEHCNLTTKSYVRHGRAERTGGNLKATCRARNARS